MTSHLPITTLTIGELARRSGLSTPTLRFYESAGVLKPTQRATNGHRRYQDNDVRWIEFVLKLKRTGMPLADIKRYAQLREQGDSTMQERLAMLQQHSERLAVQRAELAACAEALDNKIDVYAQLIANSKQTKKGSP